VGANADLERAAAAAEGLAAPGEALAAVIPTEPEPGRRIYLCAFDGRPRAWVAVDDQGLPVADRALVRGAVSIAALCELAEESAGGGKLEQLRAQLVSLRESEPIEGIEEAEAALVELEQVLGRQPRLASPGYLDAIAAATRGLEQALGEVLRSPFVEAMKHGAAVVEELQHEVEAGYKGELR
jgi:hypothetical protein